MGYSRPSLSPSDLPWFAGTACLLIAVMLTVFGVSGNGAAILVLGSFACFAVIAASVDIDVALIALAIASCFTGVASLITAFLLVAFGHGVSLNQWSGVIASFSAFVLSLLGLVIYEIVVALKLGNRAPARTTVEP